MSIEPALHTADTCADTRESKKLSVPISIKQADVFHDNAEGKVVITILFHFSRAFFTEEGRPAVKFVMQASIRIESSLQLGLH